MTTFFLDFWPKKSKVFDILAVKTFFKQNVGYFWPLLEFLKIFFFIFQGLKWDLQYNILLFFFKSQVLYLLSQVKITLNIYFFMFLKDIFVV